MVAGGEASAAGAGECEPAPAVGGLQIDVVVTGRVGVVGHGEHAYQIADLRRPTSHQQLTVGESLALPADAAVDADRSPFEQPTCGRRVIPQTAVENAGIVVLWPPAEKPDPPREPRRRPPAGR